MATLVQEDGTGKTNANTYATEAQLTQYTSDRNITLTAGNGDATEILIKAMDFIETKDFIGDKGTKAQSLQWPRSGAALNGYVLDSDEMPQTLLDAQMEVAISIDAGTNPMDNLARETTREKVGDVEVEYSPSAFAQTYLTAAEKKLKGLVRRAVTVYRA